MLSMLIDRWAVLIFDHVSVDDADCFWNLWSGWFGGSLEGLKLKLKLIKFIKCEICETHLKLCSASSFLAIKSRFHLGIADNRRSSASRASRSSNSFLAFSDAFFASICLFQSGMMLPKVSRSGICFNRNLKREREIELKTVKFDGRSLTCAYNHAMICIVRLSAFVH